MRITKINMIPLLLLLLLCSSVSPVSVSADSGVASTSETAKAEEEVLGAPILGEASIGENSFMEVKDVMLLPGDTEGIVTFTVSVHNGGESDLSFLSYWVRLQSVAGNSFTVNQLSKDGDKNRIAPGTSQSYTFYAKVNAEATLQDLVIKLVKLDFTVAGYERVIGQLTPSSSYSVLTPSGSKREIQVGGTPFQVMIDNIFNSKNEEYVLPSIYLDLVNVGTNGVKLEGLTYSMRTKSGQTYPLQWNQTGKDADFLPLDSKEVLLTGSIPIEAGTEGWQLVISQAVTAADGKGSIQLPVAFFEIPQAVEMDVSLGNDYEFENKSGTYTARLTSLQRLPWEDQDIVAANITLSNHGDQALPIPVLQGYFKLDDVVNVEASFIRTDRAISLQPGKEISFQLAGRIPYTSDFKVLNLVLQEKNSDNKVNDLLTFYHNKELMGITVIPGGGVRRLMDTGQSAAYSIRSVQKFQGESADLYTIQMEVKNLEKRFTGLRKQVAQLKAADGTVFPATITEMNHKVIPGGKALLYIYATMPKDFQTDDMQLIVGDAINLPAIEGSTVQNAYVNAASFILPDEVKEPKNGFKDLDVYPYTISLSHIGTQLNFLQGTVKLDFDYELKRDTLVDADMKDHKLIVELVDDLYDSGKELIMSQTYDFEGTDPTKSLLIGSHDALITYTNKDKIYQLSDMKLYQLNVYHQYQNGQKKLIASKELNWLTYTD